MKKKYIFPSIIAVAVLAIALINVSSASAQNSTTYLPLVQRLAQKFNLDEGEVQQVFDEERDAKRAEMYAHFAENLNDLVNDGKLTEAQKEYLEAHHEKMQDLHEEVDGLSPEARRERFQAHHDELESWAESEGIELSSILPFGGKMKVEGMGKHMGSSFGMRMGRLHN